MLLFSSLLIPFSDSIIPIYIFVYSVEIKSFTDDEDGDDDGEKKN